MRARQVIEAETPKAWIKRMMTFDPQSVLDLGWKRDGIAPVVLDGRLYNSFILDPVYVRHLPPGRLSLVFFAEGVYLTALRLGETEAFVLNRAGYSVRTPKIAWADFLPALAAFTGGMCRTDPKSDNDVPTLGAYYRHWDALLRQVDLRSARK
jgi:hypothetical protein